MGTLTEKLAYLNETKEQLKALLIESGQSVDDTTPFRSYVELCRTAIGEGGGASSDLVGYVTFMNGDVQLYQMPFIKGYDCPDPHSEGIIDTPTKESTVSTVYSFVGWSTADGDTAYNASLSGLTEDLTVYAAYTASTRYYTVTFYDGETVLQTLSVAYGDIPAPSAPEKYGYTFNSWTPELSAVTGDTIYYASWKQELTFNDTPWADCIAAFENGTALDKWSLGDEKDVLLTWEDGTTTIMTLVIAKSGLVVNSWGKDYNETYLVAKNLLPQTMAKTTSSDKKNAEWDSGDIIGPFLSETLKNAYPAELQTAIDNTSSYQIMIPDITQIGYLQSQTRVTKSVNENTFYGFTEDDATRIKTLPDGTACGWWAMNRPTVDNTFTSSGRSSYIKTTGELDVGYYYNVYGVLPVLRFFKYVE